MTLLSAHREAAARIVVSIPSQLTFLSFDVVIHSNRLRNITDEHRDERTPFRILDRRRPGAVASPQTLDPLRLGGNRENPLRELERHHPVHSNRHRTVDPRARAPGRRLGPVNIQAAYHTPRSVSRLMLKQAGSRLIQRGKNSQTTSGNSAMPAHQNKKSIS
jgi:hypothetical protein